jgi:hypothetical protein
VNPLPPEAIVIACLHRASLALQAPQQRIGIHLTGGDRVAPVEAGVLEPLDSSSASP